MPSEKHPEAAARAIAVMRAVRDRLEAAEDVCAEYLEDVDGPAPPDRDDVDPDAPAVRTAVVTLDKVRERGELLPTDRSMIEDAQEALDGLQAGMEGEDGD